jgi:hypothetical protein
MYGWEPPVRLDQVKDDLCNTRQGYSFIHHPANNLSDAYLKLPTRACTAQEDGLMRGDCWDLSAVNRYISGCEKELRLLMCIMYCLGGQKPRGTEYFTLQHCNGASSERGVYAYGGYMLYITRHHKAKHSTNQEFNVVRYLPYRARKLLYYYLVYIRPFKEMLHRACRYTREESNMLFWF